MPPTPPLIHSPAITVSDMAEALRFYTEVLPFEKVHHVTQDHPSYAAVLGNPERVTVEIAELKLGDECIQLWHFPNRPGRPVPADSRSNDAWFQHVALVVTDMEAAHARIKDRVKAVSRGPQRLPAYLPHAEGIEAFYFNDPDGHVLELIYFPPGKGDPRWQTNGLPLFAGIDHTAIGTDRTDEALTFYQDLIGLQNAGQGINYGEEQSKLNNVENARLLITTLKARRGIGLELLDYLRPGSGRPYPADSKPWDIWHWHTYICVDRLDAVYERLRAAGHPIMSIGMIDMNHTDLEILMGFLVRDPSGHVLFINEPFPHVVDG